MIGDLRARLRQQRRIADELQRVAEARLVENEDGFAGDGLAAPFRPAIGDLGLGRSPSTQRCSNSSRPSSNSPRSSSSVPLLALVSAWRGSMASARSNAARASSKRPSSFSTMPRPQCVSASRRSRRSGLVERGERRVELGAAHLHHAATAPGEREAGVERDGGERRRVRLVEAAELEQRSCRDW